MENSLMSLKYHVSPTDFTRAGEASSDVKNKLKKLGVPPEIIRKVAIAMYEGEINMVIHANGGDISVDITPDAIFMELKDVGPGIEDIDKAMRLGTNMPMGPFQLADYVGLDICLALMETLQHELGSDKYSPCPLLRKMVRAGKLGVKTGIGFYDYRR